MRRYRRGSVLAWGAGATRGYAWSWNEAGDVEWLPTAPAGRRCERCGAVLSIYNLDGNGLCWPCLKRGDEPLTHEQIVQVFEAVCEALSAPWELPDGS